MLLKFDDIKTRPHGEALMPSSYDGLNFTSDDSIYVFNKDIYGGGEYANWGIGIGVTSGRQDMLFDKDVTISSDHSFSLKSVELTSGYSSTDDVEVVGYDTHGHVKYDETFGISDSAPSLENLNYKGVSKVAFFVDQFDSDTIAIDDIKVGGVQYSADASAASMDQLRTAPLTLPAPHHDCLF